MKKEFKIGLDIHGVIDTFPERFRHLSCALRSYGAEVHIVTGIKRSDIVDQLLKKAGIQFTHYFSIVEHLESVGTPIEWRGDQPHTDPSFWNNAKRDYCEREGIDLMFDDSAIYRDTFHDIPTTFLHVINAEEYQ